MLDKNKSRYSAGWCVVFSKPVESSVASVEARLGVLRRDDADEMVWPSMDGQSVVACNAVYRERSCLFWYVYSFRFTMSDSPVSFPRKEKVSADVMVL